jgi:hypothetical protein
VTLTIVDGIIELRDQLKDYQFRGDELEEYNFLTFIMDTYEAKRDNLGVDEGDNSGKKRGRPRSKRHNYRDEARKPNQCRIVRAKGHEMLPRFVGRWFARGDDPMIRELYCASMLALLKPWRAMDELIHGHLNFDQSWQTYYATLDQFGRTVVENIQYYHECSESARRRRALGTQLRHEVFPTESALEIDDEETNDIMQETLSFDYTEEDVEDARTNRTTARDRMFGEAAMDIGFEAGFFSSERLQTCYQKNAQRADTNIMDKIHCLEKQLKETVRTISNDDENGDLADDAFTSVENLAFTSHSVTNPMVVEATDVVLSTREGMERPKYDVLNTVQRRAHDIIERHLKSHLTRMSSSCFYPPPKKTHRVFNRCHYPATEDAHTW